MTPFELLLSFADEKILDLAKTRLCNTQPLLDGEKLLVPRENAKLALLIVLAINPKESLTSAETALIDEASRQGPFRVKTHPAFLRNTKLPNREESVEVEFSPENY